MSFLGRSSLTILGILFSIWILEGAPTEQETPAALQRISITGRVLDVETRHPVPYAKVVLQPLRPVAKGTIVWAGSLATDVNKQTAQSDSNGVVSFTLTQPGDIRLTADAEGYASAEPGRVLRFTIPPGVDRFSFDIHLAKTGAITGSVVDATSEKPVGRVTVAALRRWFRNGYAYFSNPAKSEYSSGTDGGFLIKDLPPGDYVLLIASQKKVRVEQYLAREGLLPEDDDTSFGYSQVHFPGLESEPQWWNTLKVRPGARVAVGRLPVRKRPLYTVTASVHGFSCKESDHVEVLVSLPWAGGLTTLGRDRVACGPFRLRNVPEGRYRIELIGTRSPAGGVEHGSGTLEVHKNARLQVTAVLPISIPGSIAIDGAVTEGLPVNLKGLSVSLSPLTKLPFVNEAPTQVGSAKTFEVNVYPTHTYSITLQGLPSENYYVKEVVYNGSILPDIGRLTIDGSVSTHSLRIVLSTRPAGLQGHVDYRGLETTRSVTALVVEDQPDSGRRLAGRILVDPDPRGRVTKAGLRASAYYVLAVPTDSLPSLEWPGVLDSLLRDALRIRLNENQVVSVTIPLLIPTNPDQ